jgi:hypothetical protein
MKRRDWKLMQRVISEQDKSDIIYNETNLNLLGFKVLKKRPRQYE